METDDLGHGREQAAYKRLLAELHAGGWHIGATVVGHDGLTLTFRPHPHATRALGEPALVGRGEDKAAAIRDALRQLAGQAPSGA